MSQCYRIIQIIRFVINKCIFNIRWKIGFGSCISQNISRNFNCIFCMHKTQISRSPFFSFEVEVIRGCCITVNCYIQRRSVRFINFNVFGNHIYTQDTLSVIHPFCTTFYIFQCRNKCSGFVCIGKCKYSFTQIQRSRPYLESSNRSTGCQ